MRNQPLTIDTELSIEKALEFVGDNSTYQKRRLAIIAITVLSLAILTNRIALQQPAILLLFLIASGAGQIVCPIYMSLRTCTLGVGAFSLLAIALYPFGSILKSIGFLGMGFFSRGFFVSSLIYLNEIGGDRFRAWSLLLIFGLWALSPLFNSVDQKIGFPRWTGYYFLVFIPCLIGSYFVLQNWQPSPMYLYFKREFSQAKYVLSKIAYQNQRPDIPYGLQGERDNSQILKYKRHTYLDLINNDILKKITIPLCVIWIYREYIYYTSCLMIPQLGSNYSKTYIMVSISETVAVLLSYPIRLHIKRVNAAAATILTVLLMSLASSFTTIPPECIEQGIHCATQKVYLISMMMIRFAMSLLAIVLVSYTLEIYPSNVRRLGFSVCLGVSSIGSILMPWINQAVMALNFSGFITFTLASIVAIVFVPKLQQTFGRMRIQTLQQLQNSTGNSLKNWALLNFND